MLIRDYSHCKHTANETVLKNITLNCRKLLHICLWFYLPVCQLRNLYSVDGRRNKGAYGALME